MDIFLLWHTHDLTDGSGTHEEAKLIGVFSSKAKANEAIDQIKGRKGFQDFPLNCFKIYQSKIDRPGWIDGFPAIHWVN